MWLGALQYLSHFLFTGCNEAKPRSDTFMHVAEGLSQVGRVMSTKGLQNFSAEEGEKM